MNKEEILKAIMNIPKVETNNPISSMNGINVEDLMEVVDKFNRVPTYDELLKENKNLQQELTKYKERNKRAFELLKQKLIDVEIYGEQTINANELLTILEDKEKK